MSTSDWAAEWEPIELVGGDRDGELLAIRLRPAVLELGVWSRPGPRARRYLAYARTGRLTAAGRVIYQHRP